MSEIPAVSQTTMTSPSKRDAALWEAAQKLEASFLAEMLKSTNMAATSEPFGGGIGEEQFASFLLGARADLMVEAGGIGLAQSLFEALKERSNGTV